MSADRARTPLIVLHGIGANASMFDLMVEQLPIGLPVIRWNLPGYVGGEPARPVTFAGLAEDAADAIAESGSENAHVLGHSIGGMIAQELAISHPEKVRSLILSATTSFFGSRDGSFQRKFLAKRLAPLEAGKTMPELAREFAPGLIGEEPDPRALNLAIEGMAAIPANAYRQALKCLVTFNRFDDFATISAPTLLVAGETDTNAPLKTMRRMAEQLADSELVILARTGHLAPLEKPAETAAVITRFIATIGEPS